jgi:hypothetical protein
LAELACVNEACDLYGQSGQKNLTVRKIYGKDRIRYLRCQCCGEEGYQLKPGQPLRIGVSVFVL